MSLKNKLLIIAAAVLTVLIAVVNVLTFDHIEDYKKTAAELESFAFGYPSVIKGSLMCGDEYEPQSIVLEREDERFAKIIRLLDKAFTDAVDIREYNEKSESVEERIASGFEYILELFPEETLSMKIPLYDGERELKAEKATIILSGDDGGKLVVYTEDNDYIFGIFETDDIAWYLYEIF